MNLKPKIAFITLTNDGYIDLTLNCLQSLQRIGFEKELICYAIGDAANDKLSKRGYNSVQINDEKYNSFEKFRGPHWGTMMTYKLDIIYQNLLTHDYVCYTDGDIVFESPDFFQYCIENIGNEELLIQNDALDDDDDSLLCCGFMLIRSNANTINIYNPKTVIAHTVGEVDDQVYINSQKHKLKHKKLPLHFFPNGAFFKVHQRHIKPFMIHFNHMQGHIKIYEILKKRKWQSTELLLKFSITAFRKILQAFLRRLKLQF